MELKNIVLVGMPGCGKSTVGVVLAKKLCMDFIDIDLIIQKREGMTLQELIDLYGVDCFLRKEADAVESVDCTGTVIAPGGSAVLTGRGRRQLTRLGTVIYLRLPFDEIEKRLASNRDGRGIAMHRGESLRDMYDKRIPIYESCADIIIDAEGKSVSALCQEIAGLM